MIIIKTCMTCCIVCPLVQLAMCFWLQIMGEWVPAPAHITYKETNHENWAASWQNHQNDLCTQRKLQSALASAQSDQSSQCAQWVAEFPMFLYANSKDSDQTGRMPRLIWVFTGRKHHFVGFIVRWLNNFYSHYPPFADSRRADDSSGEKMCI